MKTIEDIKTEMTVGTRWRVEDVQGKTDYVIEVVGFSETCFVIVFPEFEGYTEDDLSLGFVPPSIESRRWPKCEGIHGVTIEDDKTFTMDLRGRPIVRHTKLDYKSDKKFVKCLPSGKAIFE